MLQLRFLLVLFLLLTGCATASKQAAMTAKPKAISSEGRLNVELAQNYLKRDMVDKATERAEKALALDPGSADAHALMATIHAYNGAQDKAAREFDRAMRIAPNDGSILNAHAAWLCDRGQTAKADEEFVRALQDGRYAKPQQALHNAGVCAHKAGHWKKAEDYLRRVIAVSPQNGQVLVLLADAELRQGKIMEAQAFIQRRDSLGSDAETLELAARIEDAANNAHAAARYRQRLKDEFPNHAATGEGARTP
jgi:type IV pilus assembly protein PilF